MILTIKGVFIAALALIFIFIPLNEVTASQESET